MKRTLSVDDLLKTDSHEPDLVLHRWDVYGSVAAKLRQRGFDAVSAPEADRLGETDVSQLVWATRENRVLLTFNVADFVRIHEEWLGSSRHHAGIIVSSHRAIGDLLRRIVALASSLNADEMKDRLEFLRNW